MHNPDDFAKSDKDHLLLDCCMGTAFILNSFALLAKERIKPSWDTFLINIHTLIRNNVQDIDEHDQFIINRVNKDISMILEYITEYLSLLPEVFDPHVIFYVPFYSIPTLHNRTASPTRIKINKVTKKMYDSIQGSEERSQFGNLTVIIYKVGSHKFPHLELADKLSDLNSRLSKNIYRRYLMISHCPIDFHLYTKVRYFFLLESYTGHIKTPELLGQKVFDLNIPFYTTTHLLFGDSVHIAPLVQRSEKKKFIEQANRSGWYKKTETMILDEIKKMNTIPMQTLTSVKF